jgi:hypothetical protein
LADRVLPIVRLLLPCDSAAQDEFSEKWIITNPWAVVALPEGASFPFDVEEIWLYAQLAEGIGVVSLAVEMRHLHDDGSERIVGRSEVVELEFIGGNQLAIVERLFRMTRVPFEEPGIYQFRVVANYAELKGHVAEVRVLDLRGQV